MNILSVTIFVFLIFILIGIFLFFAVNLYYSIRSRNCPYIGTSQETIDKILKEAELKEGQYLLELGCGDGRVLRQAAREYKIKGRGIDIHGWAILKAKILARLQNLKNVEFERGNIFQVKLGEAGVIYLFLTREILEKLAPKIKNEIWPGALLISHGFEIPELEKELLKTIEHGGGLPSFQRITYFYKCQNPND